MENPKVIFPDVEVRQESDKITILTSVRVSLEDGSGHYLWSVWQTSHGDLSKQHLTEMLCRFNQMVYMAMVFGKLNEETNLNAVFPLSLDDSKETERERMKRIMLKKIGVPPIR